MKDEITYAAQFLGKLLKMGHSKATSQQIERFAIKMESLLLNHFEDHWFPQKPFKGSGYRCLRINHKMDPIIARGAEASGLKFSQLQSIFPNELTVWIDPNEVSYRIGENGSICVLYDAYESSANGSDSGESCDDQDVKGTPATPPTPVSNHHMQATTPLQTPEGSPIGRNHQRYINSSYVHSFPTPPSSPPNNQGNHHQISYNSPPQLNNSCRKDLNSYWNSSSVNSPMAIDGRSSAMMGYEQMATYVAT